jgi:hypothetical protein
MPLHRLGDHFKKEAEWNGSEEFASRWAEERYSMSREN